MSHSRPSVVKPGPTRRPNPSRRKPLKLRLHRARVTFDDVARLAGVSYRMVQYVVDGQRRSAAVMAAIDRLAPEAGHER